MINQWKQTDSQARSNLKQKNYRKAIRTDLLEHDQEELPIVDGKVEINMKAHGFVSLRFISFYLA